MNSAALSDKRRRLARADGPARTPIALEAHLTDQIVKLRTGHLVTGWELAGLNAGTATEQQLEAARRSMAQTYRGIGVPGVHLWTHWIHLERPAPHWSPPARGNAFADAVVSGYAAVLDERAVYAPRLWVWLVVDLGANPDPWWRFGTGPIDTRGAIERMRRAQHDLENRARQLERGLAPWGPRRFGCPALTKGNRYSEILEAFALLANGGERRSSVALFRGDLSQAVLRARVLFYSETVEIREADDRRFAAAIGIREYPAITYPTMWQELAGAHIDCIATHSFSFHARDVGRGKMKLKRDQLVGHGDDGISQILGIDTALDELRSGQVMMGLHHSSVMIFNEDARALMDDLAAAIDILGAPGLLAVREDLGLESQWWGQLPGALDFRPRASLVTHRNFVDFAPGFGVARGDPRPHWGEPLAPHRTPENTIYQCSLHIEDAGNTIVTGMTGSGKTSILAFWLCRFAQLQARCLVLDKDRGLELTVRALGGEYRIIGDGAPTGFDPFLFPDTPATIGFVHDLVHAMVGAPWSAADSESVMAAVRSVYAFGDRSVRRLSSVHAALDATDPGGVAARLAPWLEGGRYGWVFDMPPLVPAAAAPAILGFDLTAVMTDPTVRTPIVEYLMQAARLHHHGAVDAADLPAVSAAEGRHVWMLDEFWMLLDDPFFAPRIKDLLKTIRKRNGIVIGATQSPEDAIESEIATAVLGQTATKVYFPDEGCTEAVYVDRLGLTPAEFDHLRSWPKDARRFLLKRGEESMVLEFDLAGLPELALLSPSRRMMARVDVGEFDASNWKEVLL